MGMSMKKFAAVRLYRWVAAASMVPPNWKTAPSTTTQRCL